MEDCSIQELEMRIMAAKAVLQWLHSSDPMLTDPQYAELVPAARENYSKQLAELVQARNKKKAVQVGLGTARLKSKVLGG